MSAGIPPHYPISHYRMPTRATTTEVDIDRQFREAVAQHQRGNVKAAAVTYETLRQKVPDHPELLHLLGTALVQLARPADAIPPLDKSIALRPDYAPTLEVAGIANLMIGDVIRAIELLNAACMLQPDNAVLHQRLGDASLTGGQFETACTAFEKVLEIEPQSISAAIGRAIAAGRLGRTTEAEDWLRTCVARNPAALGAYTALGTLLAQQDRFEEAEAVVRMGLQVDPSQSEALVLLAKTLHRQGRATEAEAAYRDVLSHGVRTAEVLTVLAELLIEEGRVDEAESLIREALDANPNAADSLTALGRIMEKRGQLSQALELHHRALATNATNANAYVNRGTARRFGGDDEGALHDFAQALRLKTDLPAAIASRGITLLSMERLREGWPDFRMRIKAEGSQRRRAHGQRWDGSPLDGKRVLVWTEYGLGDEIMAASLLPDLLARTAACTVAVSARLVSLIQRAFPTAAVVAWDTPHRRRLRHTPASSRCGTMAAADA